MAVTIVVKERLKKCGKYQRKRQMIGNNKTIMKNERK
jgi:hypothetical protein